MFKHQSVALLFDRPYVDAQYCFREMALQFLSHGWEVDLFTEFDAMHPLPSFESPYIRIFPYQKTKINHLLLLVRLLMGRNGRYHCIVATPGFGIYWAVQVGRLTGIPVVCLSDEIFPLGESQAALGKKWAERDRWAHQRCALTVALSEHRYQVIKEENQLPENHPYVVLPNAPSGPGKRTASSYYRELLQIPSDRGILLHSGSLLWPLAKKVAREAASWENQWALVFQGRYQGALNEGHRGNNVYFSEEVLPSEKMPFATSSADMGLALYDRENDREILSTESSAKLGLYLNCALPVICGNADSLRWIEDEGCGVWFRETTEIPAAADRIKANYENYSKNAARIFDERFDYAKFFPKFLEVLRLLGNEENSWAAS